MAAVFISDLRDKTIYLKWGEMMEVIKWFEKK